MKEEYRYLNDEELEALIADVEKNGMIAPPADYGRGCAGDGSAEPGSGTGKETFGKETGIKNRTG